MILQTLALFKLYILLLVSEKENVLLISSFLKFFLYILKCYRLPNMRLYITHHFEFLFEKSDSNYLMNHVLAMVFYFILILYNLF